MKKVVLLLLLNLLVLSIYAQNSGSQKKEPEKITGEHIKKIEYNRHTIDLIRLDDGRYAYFIYQGKDLIVFQPSNPTNPYVTNKKNEKDAISLAQTHINKRIKEQEIRANAERTSIQKPLVDQIRDKAKQ